METGTIPRSNERGFLILALFITLILFTGAGLWKLLPHVLDRNSVTGLAVQDDSGERSTIAYGVAVGALTFVLLGILAWAFASRQNAPGTMETAPPAEQEGQDVAPLALWGKKRVLEFHEEMERVNQELARLQSQEPARYAVIRTPKLSLPAGAGMDAPRSAARQTSSSQKFYPDTDAQEADDLQGRLEQHAGHVRRQLEEL